MTAIVLIRCLMRAVDLCIVRQHCNSSSQSRQGIGWRSTLTRACSKTIRHRWLNLREYAIRRWQIAFRYSNIVSPHRVVQRSQAIWVTIQNICGGKRGGWGKGGLSFLNCFKSASTFKHSGCDSPPSSLTFRKPEMTTRKWFTLPANDGLSYSLKLILNCIQLCQPAVDESRYWNLLQTVRTL